MVIFHSYVKLLGVKICCSIVLIIGWINVLAWLKTNHVVVLDFYMFHLYLKILLNLSTICMFLTFSNHAQ